MNQRAAPAYKRGCQSSSVQLCLHIRGKPPLGDISASIRFTMDNTLAYLIFGLVMAHLLIGVIWLMVKMSKKPEAPQKEPPASSPPSTKPPTPSI